VGAAPELPARNGRSLGAKTLVLLEGVDCEADGQIVFRMIVCRTGNRKVRTADMLDAVDALRGKA